MPIPEFSDVAEWPIVKQIVEPDVPLLEMEMNLVQRRAELDQEISNWGNSIKKSLADALRKELAECGYTLESPIVGTIASNLPANPFEDISPDTQLFIRADSISCSTDVHGHQSSESILSYRTFIRSIRQHLGQDGSLGLKKRLNTTHFKYHSTAPTIARALLKSLGRPENTSILELQALDERFICGKCQDNKPKTWFEMVGSRQSSTCYK